MPLEIGSVVATIVFLSLCVVGYRSMIADLVRKSRLKSDTRAIYSHEDEPRFSTLVAMGLPENIADPIARGQKINAIQAYRETYGVDLKRAKDAVEAWESALRAVEQASQPDT